MEDQGDGQNENNSPPLEIVENRFLRGLLFIAGSVSVGLGTVGIFVPLLPTTPFLLLAAACYARSSEKFYNWLLNHKWFGDYIRNFREGKGIPLRGKITAITVLWVTILFSAFYFIQVPYVTVLLVGIASGVTVYLLSLPTLEAK